MAVWYPRTFHQIGHLSGLVILGCKSFTTDDRRQTNILYHIAPMRFIIPEDTLPITFFDTGREVPMFRELRYKEFEAQVVEVILDNRCVEISDAFERRIAATIWDIWAYKSGYSQWQHELKVAEFERMRECHGWR